MIYYILFIAFFYRVALLIIKRHEPIISDSQDYHSLALSLLNGKYNIPGIKLDELRTPGYPLFLSFIYRLFGVWQYPVYLVQIILNLGSIYLAYLIGSLLFGQLTGLLAALILAIDPDFVYYVFDILTETLFTFLLLLSIYLMLLFEQTGLMIYPIITGLVLSVMTYVRPAAVFLPVVYLIFIPWQSGLYLLGCYFALLLPWFVRNYLKHGFFRLCSISGYNLLVFNLGVEGGKLGNYIKATKFCRVAHGFKRSFYNTYISKKYIRKNPLQFIKAQLKGIYRTLFSLILHQFAGRFLGDEPETPITPTVSTFKTVMKVPLCLQLVYLMVLYTALILGTFHSWFLVGIVAYFILIPGGAGAARYRVPVIPLVILMAVNFIINN